MVCQATLSKFFIKIHKFIIHTFQKLSRMGGYTWKGGADVEIGGEQRGWGGGAAIFCYFTVQSHLLCVGV